MAYLLLHLKAPLSRQFLAYCFWPESSDVQARTNLRQTLYQLRQRLPEADSFIQANSKTLQWNPQTSFRLDTFEFEQFLNLAKLAEQQSNTTAQKGYLQQAMDIYCGNLLPECYEDWIIPRREQFHQKAISALESLITLLEVDQDYDAAIGYGQRLLSLDPLHEVTYQTLMKLHLARGDRASALRIYERCCLLFKQDLGVEPSPATRDAYQYLLQQDNLPAPTASQLSTLAESKSPSPSVAVATPLVGRHQAWTELHATWRRAISGSAQLLLIKGEAGIGKTRLAEELLLYCEKQNVTTARTRCYAAEGRLVYAPVVDWLRCLSAQIRLHTLERVWLSELTRLLPELLAEHPDLPKAQPLTESWQRQYFYEAIAQAFKRVLEPSEGRPPQSLLLIVDDLQWCDPETLEWLQYFLRLVAELPVLIVGTVRSEEVDEAHSLNALVRLLHRDERVTEIALDRLDFESTAALASYIADHPLESAQAQVLFHQTEGHALFVVEMMRANLLASFARADSGSAPVAGGQATTEDANHLPPKVQSVLTARLAQLSPKTRQVANLAAAVGRSFTLWVLHQASDEDEDTIVDALDELWQYRIIREQGGDTYDFSHDKLREVAYDSISGPKRRLFHRRIAQALETLQAQVLEAVSAQVAAHYEKAGLSSKAVPYYLRAAEVAQRIYANTEAIQAFRAAIALLQTMPITPKRLEQERSLNTLLGVSLVAVKGYGSPEVKAVYEQARSLAQQLGYASSPPVIRALAITAIVQGDLRLALELGQQLLTLTEAGQDCILAVEAHYVMGVTTFWLGDFKASRYHLERAIKRYRPECQQQHLTLYAQDPNVICLSRLAFTLWCLGYPEESTQVSRHAMTEARKLSHPFTLAYALTWTTMLHSHRRDIPLTAQYASEVITLSEEKQLGIWLHIGRMLQGWTRAYTEDVEDAMAQSHPGRGIAQMQAALQALETIGAEFLKPYFLSLLADAYGRMGDIGNALDLIQQAFEAMEQSGEGWVESELFWRKGELLRLNQANSAEVQKCFEKAIAIAQSQSITLLELQATVRLQEFSQIALFPKVLSNWFYETLELTPQERYPSIFQQAITLLQTLS
ncbi:AAA family ATPase [Romeria aff. gracilis LEGE 07310]|uniref:AAA family ATPase n=1 Tax=Vasconcelosia minhoensis LEGE 07310 TaxID=915328 RepID=A0A8J7DNC5_9CYAN|nr:AAA family ATPase [Romeria gracilis]MBE9079986.1 AAA family ATPase [Romeria aff. gracilis LEGE 07310]